MAKRIAVGSIREMAKQQGIGGAKTIEVNEMSLEIKQFLSTEKKREMAIIINENSFIGEGDLKLYDKSTEDVMMCYFIIRDYTNINVMKDAFEFYDCLKASGLYELVLSHIDESEISYIKELVASRREDNYRVQNLRGMLGYKLEGLLDLLINKINDVSDVVKNFDPKTLHTLLDFVPKDKREEMLDKKNNKVDKEKLSVVADEVIAEKIKVAEDKISKFNVKDDEDKSDKE